jgi:hypothetical protein
MEHILVIANRLSYKKKLQEPCCKDCPLIAEIDTLQILARDQNIAQIEEQLGYTMHNYIKEKVLTKEKPVVLEAEKTTA